MSHTKFDRNSFICLEIRHANGDTDMYNTLIGIKSKRPDNVGTKYKGTEEGRQILLARKILPVVIAEEYVKM
jgi:hypothetical protein